METPFFELRGISKYFARVIANQEVSFSVNRGEVLALLGENGAGKSTVMKVLYGLYRADEGQIFMDGKEQKITSPKAAMALGISMIQQHFSLVPAHSVIENIILGNVHGVVDYAKCRESVQALADSYGFDIPVDAKVSQLDVGLQQKVEILKALYLNANLLIMDEPTAVLTPQEADKLMTFIREYAARGNAVILITHKLKEVMAAADRIVVMRGGRVCGDLAAAGTDEAELSRLMIGEELVSPRRKPARDISPVPRLQVQNISLQRQGEPPLLHDLSFTIAAGEIFGVAGVSGNGQEELCEIVWGAQAPDSGTISLDGQDITALPIRQRIGRGIGYVPVDRYRDAMVMDMTLAENMMLKSSYDKGWTTHGFLNQKKLHAITNGAIADYNVKTTGPDAQAKSLSGGNQQKVVLAREVSHGDSLLILNQPTRGLDLGAINNIHSAVLKEREAGKSVLLISTELSEIFQLCDRIAVMYKGGFMGIYSPEELNTEKIGLLMAGCHPTGEEART
ncbi:MAG: ABC transporter ATP-binding protein [Oscillospiraceae bacterium]